VLTRFPAETLLVAGTRYWTATGPLTGTREADPRTWLSPHGGGQSS
jgi:hypothetical protein